jgi:hypothetical protein
VSSPAKAREIATTEELRTLESLVDPSYTYACEITRSANDDRSAEAWARAVFEDAPTILRSFIVAGWIAGLGLRLGPRSSDEHVLGWKILSAKPEAIVLGVESFMLTAHLVVHVKDTRVVHATFVRFERWPSRIVWAVSAPIHRRVIPYLLGRAAVRSI